MQRVQSSLDNKRPKEKEKICRRSASCSPYSSGFKLTQSHEQRHLLYHRQRVKKLVRSDLEDRYLQLLDENFSIKTENTALHANLRKIVTKMLRISSERMTSSLNLTIDEEMRIRMLDLESHNAQLRDKLSLFTKGNSNASSRSNIHSKVFESTVSLQQSNFVLTEPSSKPELGNRQNKKLKSKYNEEMVTKQLQVTSMMELTNINNFNNEDGVDNDIDDEIELKENLKQLQYDLNEERRINLELIESNDLFQDEFARKIKSYEETKNADILKMKMDLVISEKEVERLREESLTVRKQYEEKLESEQNKIFELRATLDNEIEKNKELTTKNKSLSQEVEILAIIKQESHVIQAENELLKQHRDNITLLATELAGQKEKVKSLTKSNETLGSSFAEALANHATFEKIKLDLIQKVQDLQDRNDELIVQIQGFKTKSDGLNDRCASLEKQNGELLLFQTQELVKLEDVQDE